MADREHEQTAAGGRRALRLLGIYAAYQAFVFVLTWPALGRLSTHGIGGADKGGYDHVWYVWWARKALLTEEKLSYTPYLCFPEGYDTFDTFHNVFHEVIELPLHLVLPHVAVFNLVILVAMALAGLFAYLCARIYVEDRVACFVAGAFYLAAPVIWTSLNNGESEMSTYYWVPVDLLLLYRMTERRSWPWVVGAGIALALTCYASWYFGIEMLLFALVFVSWRVLQAWRGEGLRSALKVTGQGAAAAAVCLALVLPHVLYLRHHMHEDFIFVEDVSNLEDFFWPASPPPDEIPGVANRVGETDFYNVYYISWVLIALAAVGYLRGGVRERRLLLALALLFFVLTLGKFLRWGDRPDTFDGYLVPLPMMALYQIRLFRGIHKAFRWVVLVRLLLAILAAGGLARLAAGGGRRRLAVHGGALALFVAEFALIGIRPATMPLETFDARPSVVPEVYETVRADPDDVGVLVLPAVEELYAVSRYLFYQTHHEKKLVGPVAPLFPPWIIHDVMERYVALDSLYGEMAAAAEADEATAAAVRQRIRETRVRYVVYHPQFEGPRTAVSMDVGAVRAAAVHHEIGDDGTELFVLY